MSWFESQIEIRARLDAEITERSYAELAASVSNSRGAPVITRDDIEQAENDITAKHKQLKDTIPQQKFFNNFFIV